MSKDETSETEELFPEPEYIGCMFEILDKNCNSRSSQIKKWTSEYNKTKQEYEQAVDELHQYISTFNEYTSAIEQKLYEMSEKYIEMTQTSPGETEELAHIKKVLSALRKDLKTRDDAAEQLTASKKLLRDVLKYTRTLPTIINLETVMGFSDRLSDIDN